jgi:hypothetical protein
MHDPIGAVLALGSRRTRPVCSVHRPVGAVATATDALDVWQVPRALHLSRQQIEALLGFTLPESARTSDIWWTVATEAPSKDRHSDAWVLASRTAVPNLAARIVTFDRAS